MRVVFGVALLLGFLASGCAVLHHVQVGEVDNRTEQQVLIPFDIKVSEMGVSTDDIVQISRAVRPDLPEELELIYLAVLLSQMGPQTGAPVYNASFAEKIGQKIYAQCPSGRVSGLMSIRETAEYPVITGEIVKVTGFCAMDKSVIPISSAIESAGTSQSQILKTGEL